MRGRPQRSFLIAAVSDWPLRFATLDLLARIVLIVVFRFAHEYHDRLLEGRNGVVGSFWVANIREETQKILAVSRGEQIEATVSTVPKVPEARTVLMSRPGIGTMMS
jgi:hypothetical protein